MRWYAHPPQSTCSTRSAALPPLVLIPPVSNVNPRAGATCTTHAETPSGPTIRSVPHAITTIGGRRFGSAISPRGSSLRSAKSHESGTGRRTRHAARFTFTLPSGSSRAPTTSPHAPRRPFERRRRARRQATRTNGPTLTTCGARSCSMSSGTIAGPSARCASRGMLLALTATLIIRLTVNANARTLTTRILFYPGP